MKTLLLSYYFPPTGGAGTQRSAKFVKYLPEFGVSTVVVAGSGPQGSRWEPEDVSLLEDIPRDTAIFRAPRGGTMADWPLHLHDLGDTAVREHRPDVVLVTASPYDAVEPAIALARKHGLPSIVDLRDPWALDEFKKYPSRVHRRRAVAGMGRQLGRADGIIMNTPEATAQTLEAFPALRAERITTITNGFDPDDFSEDDERQPGKRFRIVHTGYLHTRMAADAGRLRLLKRVAGGAKTAVDVSTRSHIYLLRAVEAIVAEDPAAEREIEVILAGVLTNEDRNVIDGSSVGHLVQTPGYVSHGDAVRLMRSADALFLPLHDLPPDERATVVPGKTYEYLASRRPIVAAAPKGDVEDIIRSTRSGIVVRPSDVQGIADAIRSVRRDPWTPSADLTQYDRRVLASSLATFLRRIRDAAGDRSPRA